MTAFSIPNKMFAKIESLICALRAHINRTHNNNAHTYRVAERERIEVMCCVRERERERERDVKSLFTIG